MSAPSNATISIDASSFNALSTHLSVATQHSFNGMPQMGSLMCTIDATAAEGRRAKQAGTAARVL